MQTFPNKSNFYANYPSLANGWNVAGHQGMAPLWWDLVPAGGKSNPRWLVVFCAPGLSATPDGVQGAVVAFDTITETLYLLETAVDYEVAQARYRS